MTELSREQIEHHRDWLAAGGTTANAFELSLCNMALAKKDAEAECERLRDALEDIAHNRTGAPDWLARKALATPPPEGEPELPDGWMATYRGERGKCYQRMDGPIVFLNAGGSWEIESHNRVPAHMHKRYYTELRNALDEVDKTSPRPDAPHTPEPAETPAGPSDTWRRRERDECASCGEGMPQGECPESKRPCGHHCNHSWTQDICHWCGKEFGEETEEPGQTGDALALEDLLSEERLISPSELRKALTASGVPYIPEEVRRLMGSWRRRISNLRRGAKSASDYELARSSEIHLEELEAALASAPAVPNSADKECPECGSTNTFWWLVTENNGGAVDGRIRLSDITPLLVQSCGDCSETIQKVSSDEIGRIQIAAAPTDGRE